VWEISRRCIFGILYVQLRGHPTWTVKLPFLFFSSELDTTKDILLVIKKKMGWVVGCLVNF